jgi:hypothetical protein
MLPIAFERMKMILGHSCNIPQAGSLTNSILNRKQFRLHLFRVCPFILVLRRELLFSSLIFVQNYHPPYLQFYYLYGNKIIAPLWRLVNSEKYFLKNTVAEFSPPKLKIYNEENKKSIEE